MATSPFRIRAVERRFSQGQRLARSGDFDAAVVKYDEALQLNQAYGRIHLQRGLALSASGHHSGAISALKRAVELEPNSAVFHLYEGLVLLDAGRDEEALAAAEEGENLDPQNGLASGLLALVRFRQGQAAAACDLALKPGVLPAIGPIEARLLASCAEFLLRGENGSRRLQYSYAPALWVSALESEAALFGHVFALEVAAEDSDRTADTANQATPNATEPPSAPDAGVYSLAVAALPALQEERLTLATHYFRGLHPASPLASTKPKRTQRTPDAIAFSADMLSLQALVLKSLHRTADAATVLEQAIAENPESPTPRFILGLMAGESGDSAESLHQFELFAQRSHGDALRHLLLIAQRTTKESTGGADGAP